MSDSYDVGTALKYLITVMPDYGMGPYAWQKSALGTSALIGTCIATAVDGFETEEEMKSSSELQESFANWTAEFE